MKLCHHGRWRCSHLWEAAVIFKVDGCHVHLSSEGFHYTTVADKAHWWARAAPGPPTGRRCPATLSCCTQTSLLQIPLGLSGEALACFCLVQHCWGSNFPVLLHTHVRTLTPAFLDSYSHRQARRRYGEKKQTQKFLPFLLHFSKPAIGIPTPKPRSPLTPTTLPPPHRERQHTRVASPSLTVSAFNTLPQLFLVFSIQEP